VSAPPIDASGASGSKSVSAPPDLAQPGVRAFRVRNVTRDAVVAERVDLAASFGARFRGLMGRRSLAPGCGLWLTGTSNIHMFFMRFPIDAVFLGRPGADGARRVVAVHADLRPWTGIVWYARGADACLEMPAGTAATSRTVVGDVVATEQEPAGG
jgi:uncharacterized membrane protein (UPF0127 family)